MSNKPAAKIHLDKSEFWVICGIVFLFAGLTFSIGVMVGAGLGADQALEAELTQDGREENLAQSNTHHTPHKKADRKVASTEGPSKKHAREEEHSDKEEEPGQKLRNSFRSAKQRDFEEMLAIESTVDEPVSVQDSKAYFDSREKSKAEDRDLPLESNLSGMVEKRDPASEGVVHKDPPKVVKSLFERKPASANDYAPVFGEYTVLVASYATEDEAESKIAGLRSSGFDDAYYKTEKSKEDGAQWYRVNVGSFKDLKWALKTKETLKKKNLSGTPIVRKVE